MHVRALAALVLGLCLEHWGEEADEESGWAKKDILSIIEHRVGLTPFTATLEKLDKSLVPGSVTQPDHCFGLPALAGQGPLT